MAVNKENCIIGPAILTLDGIDLGLTPDDVIELIPEYDTVKLAGAQAMGNLKSHRKHVMMTAKFTVLEVSLANLAMLMDLAGVAEDGTLQLDFQSTVTRRILVVTGPGPEGGTRTQTFSVGINSAGGVKYGNSDYASMEIEVEIYLDPTTNRAGTIVDSDGDDVAPAPASYQYLVAGTPTTFTDGASTVPDGATSIQATFNVRIRPDQLDSSHFALKTAAGNTQLAGTVTYGTTASATDFTKVLITPTAALDSSEDYELIIMAGLKSNEGVASTAMASVQFTTTA